MTASEIVTSHRSEILAVATKHGARNVRLFGSVARGSDDEHSDIDLIVDFDPERSLMDHAALSLELQDLLGHKVDVVSGRGLKPRIRDRFLTEAGRFEGFRRAASRHPRCDLTDPQMGSGLKCEVTNRKLGEEARPNFRYFTLQT